MPGTPWYGGQVVRAATVAEMKAAGILDRDARVVPVHRRLARALERLEPTPEGKQ